MLEGLGQVSAVGAQGEVEDVGGGFPGGCGAQVGAVQDGPELLAFGLVTEVCDGVLDGGSKVAGVGAGGGGGQGGAEEGLVASWPGRCRVCRAVLTAAAKPRRSSGGGRSRPAGVVRSARTGLVRASGQRVTDMEVPMAHRRSHGRHHRPARRCRHRVAHRFVRGQAGPRVTGVLVAGGHTLRADLVVDCAGRRSALTSWLQAAGARRPAEERADCGFIYYAAVPDPHRCTSRRPHERPATPRVDVDPDHRPGPNRIPRIMTRART